MRKTIICQGINFLAGNPITGNEPDIKDIELLLVSYTRNTQSIALSFTEDHTVVLSRETVVRLREALDEVLGE